MILNWAKRQVALATIICVFAVPTAAFAQTAGSVQKQINSKGGLIAGLAAKLKASETQAAELTKKIAENAQELAKLQALMQDQTNKNSLLTAQKAEASNQLAKNEVTLKALESALQEKQAALAASEETVVALRALEAEFKAQKGLIDGLYTKISEQDGRVIELQSQLDVTKSDLGSAGGKIGAMAQNLGNHGSTISDLKAELDQAIYVTRERDAEIRQLKTDVTEAKSTHRGNQKTIEELEFQRIILGGLLLLMGLGLFMSFRRRR